MSFEELHLPLQGTPRMSRGRRAKYVPNHRSFGAFIRSEQMRDVTADVAEDIAIKAAANTRRPTDAKEGKGLHAKVRGGFRVKRGAGLMKVGGNLRVKVEVVNNADGAALVEFGANGLPRSRPLGRAGAAFGDFKPDGSPK